MKSLEEQIDKFLLPYSAEIRTFAQELRIFLKNETNPSFELAGMSAQSFNIGYGFTTTAWDCFCAIIVYRNHINISFPSGAGLPDPKGLLHGTGSRIRHIKIKQIEDVHAVAIRNLLKVARENAFLLVGSQKIGHAGVKTVIKRKGDKKK